LSNPEYVKVDEKLYKINTDFRVALECNKIAEDVNIGDYERALAIIYKLFGEKGLDCENQNKLIELAVKYLSINQQQKGFKNNSSDNYELDFNKCEGLIKSSFKFDYGYDPYEAEYLHWWNFYNDLQNLSSSEFGTCCILNRVAEIVNMDTKNLKGKELLKIQELQQELRRKYCKSKKKQITKEEKQNVVNLYKQLGLWKGE
jgi:hypothetical protein